MGDSATAQTGVQTGAQTGNAADPAAANKGLSPKQRDWLEERLGDVAAIGGLAGAGDVAARKQAMLKDARTLIEGKVGVIAVGEDFEARVRKGGLLGFLGVTESMGSISRGGDANDEIDTGHDTVTAIDPDTARQLMQAHQVVADQVEDLRRAYDFDGKRPLFTDKEIADAIWAPLMRRKIIPENAIPDRYSEVTRTFAGASAEYEERLDAYTESLGKWDKVAEKLGIAKEVVNVLGTCAGAAVTSLEAIGVKIDASQASNIMKLTQAALSGGLDVAQQVAKQGISTENVNAIAKSVLGAVTASITMAFAQAAPDHPNLAKAINSGLSIGLAGVSFGVRVKKGEYSEALADVGAMVAASCAVYSSDRSEKGEKETATVNTAMLGTFIADALKAAGPGKKFVDVCIAERKKADDGGEADLAAIGRALLALMETMVQGAVNSSSTWYLPVRTKALEKQDGDDAGGNVKSDGAKVDKDTAAVAADGTDPTKLAKDEVQLAKDGATLANDEAHKPAYDFKTQIIEPEWTAMQTGGAASAGFMAGDKLMAQIQAKSPEELKKLYEKDPAMKKLADLVKAQQLAAVQDANETMDARVAADSKGFRDMLNRSETGDAAGDVTAIETLILQIKKDQMIVQLVEQLVKLPAAAVAAFVPQAGIAVTSIELLCNIRKAIEHFVAYEDWRENTSHARAAMSVQVEAMANRAGLSFDQGMQQVIAMLENGAKLVAQSLSVAGPMAPAGHVASAVISAEQAVRALLVKFYTMNELRQAWNTYQAALENPDDRKLARKAIRDNPTLAKYVIAYGAEVENNPVARNAMQKCGLSAEVLDSASTNVQKVVAYLEALYPEDPVLLNANARPATWYPGPVELTATGVAAFFGAAERTEKLAPSQGRALVNALVEMQAAQDRLTGARDAWFKAQEVLGKASDPAAVDAARQKETDELHTAQKALEQAVGVWSRVTGLLQGFRPMDTGGKAHGGMGEYVRQLLPVAKANWTRLDRERATLFSAPGAQQPDKDGLL